MTCSTTHRLWIEDFSCLYITLREKCANIDLEVLSLGIVGRVGIEHTVLVNNECLGVLAVNHHATCNVNRLCESAVAYCHAVVVAALVDAEQTVLHCLVAILQLCLVVCKAHGETQRAIVENLILLVAIWEEEIVALDDCRCAAAECWTNLVAVETIAMVEMIACAHFKSLGCRRVFFLQFGNDGLVNVLNEIALLHHERRSVLQPHVVAKGTFATALQCRTIAAVGTTVVFPCYVVNTLWIHSSVACVNKLLWLALGYGEHCVAIRTHGSLDEHLAVVGKLVGNLLSHGVGDNELSATADAKTTVDFRGFYLYNLLTLPLATV